MEPKLCAVCSMMDFEKKYCIEWAKPRNPLLSVPNGCRAIGVFEEVKETDNG